MSPTECWLTFDSVEPVAPGGLSIYWSGALRFLGMPGEHQQAPLPFEAFAAGPLPMPERLGFMDWAEIELENAGEAPARAVLFASERPL